MASAQSIPSLDRYLGAGRVVRCRDRALVLLLEDGSQVHATLALAFPYKPVRADKLLVLGDATSFYAIGVLEGRGRSELDNPKGVALHAENGRLRLSGDRGVRVRGERIQLQASELVRVALSAVHTFGRHEKRVRELLRLHAGEADELSQGRWVTHAKRAVLKALDGARVKSAAVRLG